jgi:hypothetical protein
MDLLFSTRKIVVATLFSFLPISLTAQAYQPPAPVPFPVQPPSEYNPIPASVSWLSDNPSNVEHIDLKHGYVDAITGCLHASFPLGPKLPGRIPIGFTWVFKSNGPLESMGGSYIGGVYRPVVWPVPELNLPQITAYVNGEIINFV